MISPTILAIVIAVFSGLAFTGGFAVADWRSGAQIARLASENAVLEAANGKCTTDIESVRQSVISMQKAADERVKAADAAMVVAQPKAAIHTRAAITIKAAPIPIGESLCAAVEREQKEYVQARHTDN